MARKASGRPTDTELEILRIVWANGPRSVRQVHEELQQTKDVAYSTVLTQMQFMYKKGMLLRDETYHSHIYKAVKTQLQTERSLVRSLIKHTFGGSARSLVLRALETENISSEELERIDKLFED